MKLTITATKIAALRGRFFLLFLVLEQFKMELGQLVNRDNRTLFFFVCGITVQFAGWLHFNYCYFSC